jgi:hypothetical protein
MLRSLDFTGQAFHGHDRTTSKFLACASPSALFEQDRQDNRWCDRQHSRQEDASEPVDECTSGRTAPWHVWVVAILTPFGRSGMYTIVMAQMGRLPDLDASETAYYSQRLFWLVIATEVLRFCLPSQRPSPAVAQQGSCLAICPLPDRHRRR